MTPGSTATGASARSGENGAKPIAAARALRTAPYGWLVIVIALAALVALGALRRDSIAWLIDYPDAWVIPLTNWISAFFHWLGYDLDFGLFSFRDLTRGLSWVLGLILSVAEGILLTGWPAFGIPPLPWLTVVTIAGVFGHYAGNWRVALIGAACFAYLALFGVWQPSMETFALVIVTVPAAAAAGLFLGLAVLRRRWLEALFTPVLNTMQATPHFAYLVPVIVLFGFGKVPALIATGIFAMPPMARCTILGVRAVPGEVIEAGRMAGCTPRQLLWKLALPSARPTLLLGLNQVIMMTLAMVVIASLIGAPGLGHHVLTTLNMLKLGTALELGVAIVVLAIALDRLSRAYALMKPAHREDGERRLWRRHPHFVIGSALIGGSLLLALFWPALRIPPPDWTITTAPFWNALVDWVTIEWYEELRAIRTFALLYFMLPLRDALLWLPWPVLVVAAGSIGYRLGGLRTALLVTAMAVFPVVTGFWVPTMRTLYLIGSAVLACILLGFPIGLFAARHDRAERVITTICDTLQTFPSFIYLIPVVMLFKTGPFAASIAVVIYAIVPMIRYTNAGLRQVPAETVEAGRTIGCTQRQLLWKIQIPLALPRIMLGVNQTIMMGLFMVAIAALVGTQDLGQEINLALTNADSGRGLVAGLCVAAIGLTADQLIGSWAAKRNRQLGLE